MGSSVYPAASGGGSGSPLPKAGALVSSGSTATNGFFLSDTLPAGNYVIVADVARDTPNQYEENYISVNAPKSGYYHWLETTDSTAGIRVTLTQSEKIAVGAAFDKAGVEWYPDTNHAMRSGEQGSSWQQRSYYIYNFRNSDKYFVFWGNQNNGDQHSISYHNFANVTTFDVIGKEDSLINISDANLGYPRPLTNSGVVGNYAYFAFTANTAAQRLWRANLTTPTTWTVGTTAATTEGAIMGIAYDGSIYVLVTSAGHINTSPDFNTWTKQTSPSTDGYVDIKYLNGQFIAVGYNGCIVTSPNGFTWTKRTTPQIGVSNFYNISYINGRYLAFGGGPAYEASRFWNGTPGIYYHAVSSDNGVTWTGFDLQPTQAGMDAPIANKYGNYQLAQRHGFANETNMNYGQSQTYIYNGYIVVDMAADKKFISSDGINWHCIYKLWDNRNILLSPTHGLLNIYPETAYNDRTVISITKPTNTKVYIYAETD